MYENLDEVCVALDELALRSLELMEKKVSVTLQMEELIRDGHIELAKARYIRGMETTGILQIPTEAGEFESLFEIQRSVDRDEIPQFDIVSRKENSEGQEIRDPIKWFGVLVPQNLRNAQKRFQSALQFSAKCANISTEIISCVEKLEVLKDTKNKFCEEEE